MNDDAEPFVPLYVAPGHVGTPDLELRFPVEYADEILSLLDEQKISHSTAVEFSAGTDLAIETVRVLATPAGLTALAAVIHAVVRRHAKKKFRLRRNGLEVRADGYSAAEVSALLSQVAEEKKDADKRIKKQLGYEVEDE